MDFIEVHVHKVFLQLLVVLVEDVYLIMQVDREPGAELGERPHHVLLPRAELHLNFESVENALDLRLHLFLSLFPQNLVLVIKVLLRLFLPPEHVLHLLVRVVVLVRINFLALLIIMRVQVHIVRILVIRILVYVHCHHVCHWVLQQFFIGIHLI